MNVENVIKRGRKFDQVVEGAACVFMAEGFEGASVDAIAKEAGVSKATLYSYFPDKKLLFLEVARREITRQASLITEIDHRGLAPREVLTQIGMNLSTLIHSRFGMSVYRVVIAESERFPEIAQQFYTEGPCVTEARMVAYFQHAEKRGALKVDDPRLASHQFVELCKADCFFPVLIGLQPGPTADELRRSVNSAVDVFLARYGV
jgi:AcrR family transcriptional regulator